MSRGLTQAQVRALLGVSASEVAEYESYDWDPTLSVLEQYANAVGATVVLTIQD